MKACIFVLQYLLMTSHLHATDNITDKSLKAGCEVDNKVKPGKLSLWRVCKISTLWQWYSIQ